MAFIPPHDRVLERSTSNSQSVFTVTGAADASFNAFSAFMAVGDTTFGFVIEPGVAFKSGQLTYSASNQITIDSSVFGGESKGTFSAGGTKEVGMGLTAGRFNAIDRPPVENLIINGGMEVNQPFGTAAQTGLSSTVYVSDSMTLLAGGGGVITAQQVADAPAGFKYSMKFSVTTADSSLAASDLYAIYQWVVGYRAARLGFGAASARSLSIGFWVKANRTGTYSAAIQNSAQNRAYPFNFTVNSSLTWEYKTVTIPGDTTGAWDTTTGAGLRLYVTLASGTGNLGTANTWVGAAVYGVTGTVNGVAATSDTFQITGVSAIDGAVPIPEIHSPLIVPTFDRALNDCQFFYEKSFDYSVAPAQNADSGFGMGSMVALTQIAGATTNRWNQPFKVRKRSNPTMTAYNPAAANAQARNLTTSTDASGTALAGTETSVFLTFTGPGGGAVGDRVAVHWTADSRL